MNEQFKPIGEETKTPNTPNNGFTSIVEEKSSPANTSNIVNNTNEEVLKGLPEWNLEPPVEIDRGK